MEKKYELIKHENGMFQIKALRDFSDVKTGDLGGFVDNEDNLSHYGDCWIYNVARVSGDASVYDNARVSGDARVHGNAKVLYNASVFDNAKVSGHAIVSGHVRVSGHARVSGDAIVSGNARVYGDATVFDNASVYGHARVSGDAIVSGHVSISGHARVSGDARVFGNARVLVNASISGNARVFGGKWNISPLQIQGSKHFVTTSSYKTITIGCVTLTIDEWVERYRTIGINEGYSEDDIEEYRKIIVFCGEWLESTFINK